MTRLTEAVHWPQGTEYYTCSLPTKFQTVSNFKTHPSGLVFQAAKVCFRLEQRGLCMLYFWLVIFDRKMSRN